MNPQLNFITYRVSQLGSTSGGDNLGKMAKLHENYNSPPLGETLTYKMIHSFDDQSHHSLYLKIFLTFKKLLLHIGFALFHCYCNTHLPSVKNMS